MNIICLIRGHKWGCLRERGELDFYRACDRCPKVWRDGPRRIPPAPTPPAPPIEDVQPLSHAERHRARLDKEYEVASSLGGFGDLLDEINKMTGLPPALPR